MKKGCFFVSFILLTIIIAVGIYLFKYHSPYVVNVFKPVIVSSMRSEFERGIKKVENSALNDSLKFIVNDYIKGIEKAKQFDMKDAQFFFDNVRDMLHDGMIDSSEISDIKLLLTKSRDKNERSAKN